MELENIKLVKQSKVQDDKVEQKNDEISRLKTMLRQAQKENVALKAKLECACSGEKHLNVIYPNIP